jgi:hypothetical protein
MALLLAALASPVAADIKINLFVLDQICRVAATNALLSNALCARRVQAGQQGAGGPAGRRQEQSSCTSYVLTWRPFAVGVIFKTPEPNRKMRSGMPRAARRLFFPNKNLFSSI